MGRTLGRITGSGAAAAIAFGFLSLAFRPAADAGVASAALPATPPGVAADGAATTLAQFGRRDDSRGDDVSRGGREGGNPGSGGHPGQGAGRHGVGRGHSGGGSGGGGNFGTGLGVGIGMGIGSAIIEGARQCAAQTNRCESRYGAGTARYRRCMSDGGC